MKLPAGLKLSRTTLLGIGAIGILLVAWLTCTLAFSESDGKTTKAAIDAKHCPLCERELRVEGSECQYCKAEGKGAEAQKARAGRSFFSSPVIPASFIALFCTLLTFHVARAIWLRYKVNKEEVFYVFNCPKCERRLRYRMTQIKKVGQCPQCKRPLIFPKPEEEARQSVWAKLRTKMAVR